MAASHDVIKKHAFKKMTQQSRALREIVDASARIWLVPAHAWRHHGLWRDGSPGGGCPRFVRPRRAGRGESGLRIFADSGGLDLLGGMDHGRVHGGAIPKDQ